MNVAAPFINEKSFANYAEQQEGRAVSPRLHTDGAAAELIWTQASQPAAAVAADAAT